MSYETVRAWSRKFGKEYAKRLRRSRRPVGDTWHLDEVYLKTKGQFQHLWRAVDQEDQVIDVLVKSQRDTHAAYRFFRKLLGNEGKLPRRIITNRLGSYRAAMRAIIPGDLHIQDKGANNRAENSYKPIRGW